MINYVQTVHKPWVIDPIIGQPARCRWYIGHIDHFMDKPTMEVPGYLER